MSWWDKNKQKKEKKQHQDQQVKMLQNIATLSRFAKAGLLFISFINEIMIYYKGKRGILICQIF